MDPIALTFDQAMKIASALLVGGGLLHQIRETRAIARAAHSRIDEHSKRLEAFGKELVAMRKDLEYLPAATAQKVLSELGAAGIVDRRNREARS